MNMTEHVTLDEADRRLLRAVQRNAAMSADDMAEAVGLSRAMCKEFFPGMISRISGIGVSGIQKKVEEVHAQGFGGDGKVLPIGGFYKSRKSGETHAWTGPLWRACQE